MSWIAKGSTPSCCSSLHLLGHPAAHVQVLAVPCGGRMSGAPLAVACCAEGVDYTTGAAVSSPITTYQILLDTPPRQSCNGIARRWSGARILVAATWVAAGAHIFYFARGARRPRDCQTWGNREQAGGLPFLTRRSWAVGVVERHSATSVDHAPNGEVAQRRL